MKYKKRTSFGLLTVMIYFIYLKSTSKTGKLDPLVSESSQYRYFQKHYKKTPPVYQQKINDAGFFFEEHKILTSDGYILTACRILIKLLEQTFSDIKHYPFIFLHILFFSSFTWLLLDASHSLPLILAESGYDVWLTNTRGNAVSFEHENMNNFNSYDVYSKYWDFSFH